MNDQRNLEDGDEYLWDPKSTTAAQDVQLLEKALQPVRYRGEFEFPQQAPINRFRVRASLAAAAVLLIGVGLVWFSLSQFGSRPQSGQQPLAWNVQTLLGDPRIDSTSLADVKLAQLNPGQWLETDANSQAKVMVADIGHVTVEPHSRVRLVATSASEHRLELARGKIDALIYAPPRLFVVDTPAATAVDLGCAYNLTVDEDGNGLLEVTLGWVSLESGRFESIVPRGAVCLMRQGVGPGTPFFADASPRLKDELARFDFERVKSKGDDPLSVILEAAQPRDSLTLWHLLPRVHQDQRKDVFDKLIAFAPLPQRIAPEAILGLDAESLREWRQSFAWSPVEANPKLKAK